MTRKSTRKTPSFRGIAPLIAVLTLVILIALAALAQTRGAGPASGQNGYPGPRLFVPAVGYDSGGYTGTAAAVGDLNGDGKLDVVVANYCSDSGCQVGEGSAGVLLGNGDGTFQAVKTYDSGGVYARAVAIADLNGDHKPDLIVANGASNTVGVLLGNGDGTFQPAVTYGSGGMFPSSVAVADVNGDDIPDILLNNACSDPNCDGTAGVLLGNGNGTFQPVVTYSSGALNAFSVAVADVNHDGKPDLIVGNSCGFPCDATGAVAVLLGNGDGTFRAAVIYNSGFYIVYSVTVADVNGDGNPDLVVANGSNPGTVGVLLGNGDGTFRPAITYDSGGSLPFWVAVADVNGDGKLDLIVANSELLAGGDGDVGVLLGNGDGTFQPVVNYLSGGSISSLGGARSITKGKSRPDLFVINMCDSSGYNCGGPINLSLGSVGVLLNNVGATPTTTSLVSSVNPADINWVVK